jgi:hypothetical protein
MIILDTKSYIFLAMKTTVNLLFCLAAVLLLNCKKDDNVPELMNSYGGTLSLEYSRDFPDFSETVTMPIDISKSGDVTFGSGGSAAFNAEDIQYDGADPVLKIKMEGTLDLQSAEGRCDIINNEELVFIKTISHIWGTMYIWIWDDDLQIWVEPPVGPHEIPFDYQDSYSDGEMQFSILDACMDLAEIKATLSDVHGTWTYGYALSLVVALVK